jgi:hypothetical protein
MFEEQFGQNPPPDQIALVCVPFRIRGGTLLASAVLPGPSLPRKDHHLLGKRVLSTGGDDLGKVDDVEFDPGTGTITALLLPGGEVAGIRLVGVGSYAVVLQAD